MGVLKAAQNRVETKLVAATPALPEVPDPNTPSFATSASVRTYLERMSRKVEKAELLPSQADAIAKFASLAIKLAELQNERDLLSLEMDAAANDTGRRR